MGQTDKTKKWQKQDELLSAQKLHCYKRSALDVTVTGSNVTHGIYAFSPFYYFFLIRFPSFVLMPSDIPKLGTDSGQAYKNIV